LRALISRRTETLLVAAPLLLALLPLGACGEFGGGPRTVSRDGFRAVLAFSPEDRYEIAIRGNLRRVSGSVEGSDLIKILRPDLGKVWQFRPSTKKLWESAWSLTEELVPGYPLEPRFEPEAYAARFGATIRRIDDAAHGMHPCERYEMTLPSGDQVVVWVARDLERLVVRIEHSKKDTSDEHQPFTDSQLLDIRVGAPRKLFEAPGGYTRVRSFEELSKG